MSTKTNPQKSDGDKLMAKLVRHSEGRVEVAGTVFGPGYVLDADAADETTQMVGGWGYSAEDVEPEQFVAPWAQPIGAHDAYSPGAIVLHDGIEWVSLVEANVWEPGVSGWAQCTGSEYPTWVQPSGAHDAYPKGMVVTHAGARWESLLDANVWEPGVSGWRPTLMSVPVQMLPAWVQPSGAHDAYQLGSRVRHNDVDWESIISNNVWEPGVYGWTQI